MDLGESLLKSIWYAFTSLEAKSDKVSKSQLKVLSHSLYTVLKIPIDPKILEDHFRDDENSLVSKLGYMSYLTKYILDKVCEGSCERKKLDEMCWMLTAKKNYRPGTKISETNAFQLWCLFNFLSEDTYPLIMVPDEVGYLLKKLLDASGLQWHQGELEDYLSHKDPSLFSGMSVWQFLEMMECTRFFPFSCKENLSLAIDDVYQEMYLNMIKKAYLWKKGLSRRNWNERWFVLKPPILSYYTAEDLKDKKGEIYLSKDCVTALLPDKENRRCLFCIKTLQRTYEISASDTRQRHEWMSAIQTAIQLGAEEKTSLHSDLKMRRRTLREQTRRKSTNKEMELQKLQEERDTYIKAITEIQDQMEILWDKKNQQTLVKQEKFRLAMESQLKQAEMGQKKMQSEIVQKEEVAEQQRQRIKELESMKQQVEMALQAETQARLEAENMRVLQARLLDEEEKKLNHLKHLNEEQDKMIQRTQEEKEELQQEMLVKSQALVKARCELISLQNSRKQNKEGLEEAQKKLDQASRHVTHWSVKMHSLMRPIPPGESANPPSWDILSNRRDGVFSEERTAPISHQRQPETDSRSQRSAYSKDPTYRR